MIDITIDTLISLRIALCFSSYSVVNYTLWILTSILSLQAATSVGFFISPNADGSGYGEIKNILFGIPIYKYLSFRSLVAKCLGLIASKVSCASIGRVGPYVHISCLFCNQMLNLKPFKALNKDKNRKNSLLASAAAIGITLSFGTPLGGIIFSIESTSSANSSKHIWKTVLCAIISKLMIGILPFTVKNDIFISAEMLPVKLDYFLIYFVLAGLLCGFVGAALSKTVAKIKAFTKTTSIAFLRDRFKYVLICSVIIANITFFLNPLYLGDRTVLSYLFIGKRFRDAGASFEELEHPDEADFLFLLIIFKFTLIVLSLSMPLPAGIISPFISLGAYIGKFYRHSLGDNSSLANENIYSIICGASLLAGVNQSISSAVIIFELTGEASYLAPLLLNSMIANLFSKQLGKSLAEVFSGTSSVEAHLNYGKTKAEDVMDPNLNFCIKSAELSVENSIDVLLKLPKKFCYSLVLLDEDNRVEYTFKPKALFKALKKVVKKETGFNSEFKTKLLIVMHLLAAKFEEKELIKSIRNKWRKYFKTQSERENLRLSKESTRREAIEIWNKIRDGSVISRI